MAQPVLASGILQEAPYLHAQAAATELVEGSYASEETLHSSVAFLRNTLAGAQAAYPRRTPSLPSCHRPPDAWAACARGRPPRPEAAHVLVTPTHPPAPPAAAGVSQDLDLLSREPRDVVNACNTVYGLLLQHQRDAKFKEQLKTGEGAEGPGSSGGSEGAGELG
jgi:hypothetical protein